MISSGSVSGSAAFRPAVVQQLCIFYMAAWCISPPLAFGTIWRVLFAGAVIIWLIVELLRFPSLATLLTGSSALAFGLGGYIVVILLVLSDGRELVYFTQLLIALFFLIPAGAYNARGWEELKPALLPILLLSAVWAATTLLGLAQDQHAARYVVRTSQIAQSYSEAGVGGYGLTYYMIFAALTCLALATRPAASKPAYRLVLLGLAAVMALMVLKAGYSIAVLILLASTIGFVVFRVARPGFSLVFGLVLAALLVLAQAYSHEITQVSLSLTEGTPYRQKVFDISRSLFGDEGGAIGTVSDRQARYVRSWQLFLDNPATGTFSRQDIGKHSQLLDMLAQFGILIGCLVAYIFTVRPALAARRLDDGRALQIAACLAAALWIAFNNVTFGIGFGLFILVPLAASVLARDGDGPVALRIIRLARHGEATTR